MRISVFVFLDFEGAVFSFQFDGDVYVDIDIVLLVFVILDIPTTELTKTIDEFSFAIDHGEDANAVSFANFIIIGPESRSGMDDTGSIFGSHE